MTCRARAEGHTAFDKPIVVVDCLTRRFGQRNVVSTLDFELSSGERVALCGPNGSGKTTILRCIAGTVTPTDGNISVGGYPAASREARRLVGVSLSQERSFYLRLSGRENLLFFAGARGIGRRAAVPLVAQLEDELELRAIVEQRVDRCSTGMIQQLSFARALIGEPPVLLLDEPTRSLDTAAVKRFWQALDRRTNTALLLATHRDEDIHNCGSSLRLNAA